MSSRTGEGTSSCQKPGWSRSSPARMAAGGDSFPPAPRASVLDLDPLLAGRIIFDQRQLLGVDRDVVLLREAEIAGDALEPFDGVESLLQVRRLGRLRVVDHLTSRGNGAHRGAARCFRFGRRGI